MVKSRLSKSNVIMGDTNVEPNIGLMYVW